MATYEYNDKIKFVLPAGYLFSREEDEGEEVVNILAGEYEDDEGETCYKFSLRLNYTEFEPEDVDENATKDNMLDFIADRVENSKSITLPGSPKIILLNAAMPLIIFGSVMKMYATIALVQVSDWSVLQMLVTGMFNDDDPRENSERYERLCEVLKAIRIDGKKLSVDSVSPAQIEKAIQLTFGEDEAIDVSPKLQFNITTGDETTTYEYTADGMKEVGKEKLRSVDPDEKLYPHYASIKNSVFNFFPGAVVNGSGTEFEFQTFTDMLNTWSTDPAYEERKPLLQKINDLNPAGYTLADTARGMVKLFRVDKDAFVEGHDRESELTHGYMRRAYMMSAIRSFAWTLADYCQEHEVTPEDVDCVISSRIADFVASRNWLNYDGKTYCKGLCSGSDLHVYFLPDATSKADKSEFLPSKEDKERVKEMKERNPNYSVILCEVHSLEALRKDLEYIYPAIQSLYDSLAEERDTSESLEGNAADIVYAWIALAMAAEGPFFTEDGPMNYGFGWPGEEEEWEAAWEEEEAARVEEEAKQWMDKYEKYIEKKPAIDFNGSIFVFSGLAGHGEEKEHPTVQKVIEKGGQYRSKVSGLTNYLVVNPGYAGQSKIVAVMEQLQKGKNIKVILLEDLEKALEGASSSKAPSSTATKTTATKTTATKSNSVSSASSVTKATGKKVSKAGYEVDDFGTLTAYSGSEKTLVFPDGITAIGEDAFLSNTDVTSVVIPEGTKMIGNGAFWLCENLESVILPSTIRKIGDNAFNGTALTSIVIPDGCEEIGADCFTGCGKLKDIYVPGSVRLVGDDAFCTFNDVTIVHTEKNSAAESVAEGSGIKVDYKSAPKTATSTKSNLKNIPSMDEAAGLADTMSDLSAQVAEMQGQELSDEDRETLSNIMDTLGNVQKDLAEGQVVMGKYGDYLERKEAMEKAQEEEKARKKAEALAAGKSEKDIVNMYIILTNEKKMGQLHRNQDEFFEIYEEDFAALSKSEVIQTRKDMLAEMEDESLCSYYAESFKQRTVEERFITSTLNLNNVSKEPDFGKKAEFAVENTKEWYASAEYAEVRKLMDAKLAENRNQIEEQLRPVEEKWLQFATATEFLQIEIAKKADDDSDMQEGWSCFQHRIGSDLISVQLTTKGMFKIVTNVMNFNPWYWGVTVRDIWEAARKNNIRDDREGADNADQLADQALAYIRTKYPETTGSSSVSSSSQPAPVQTSASTSVPSSNPQTSQQAPTAKKEGCYIATAVYGSYDAPEVMTLRRFRDETLKKSAFGRWFIRTYYRLSPPVAEKLKNAKRINAFVRSILDKWVENLERKQR